MANTFQRQHLPMALGAALTLMTAGAGQAQTYDNAASQSSGPLAGAAAPIPQDNTNRFYMEQNGKRMTVADFDEWMLQRGIHVSTGRGIAGRSTENGRNGGQYFAGASAAPQIQAVQAAPAYPSVVYGNNNNGEQRRAPMFQEQDLTMGGGAMSPSAYSPSQVATQMERVANGQEPDYASSAPTGRLRGVDKNVGGGATYAQNSRPEQVRPEQVRPEQARPGEARPGEARPGEARPGEIVFGMGGGQRGSAQQRPAFVTHPFPSSASGAEARSSKEQVKPQSGSALQSTPGQQSSARLAGGKQTIGGGALRGGQSFVSSKPLYKTGPTTISGSSASKTPGGRVDGMTIKVASNPIPEASSPGANSPGINVTSSLQATTEGAKIEHAVFKVAKNVIPSAQLDVGTASADAGITTPLASAVPASIIGGRAGKAKRGRAGMPLPDGLLVGGQMAPPRGAPKGLPPGPIELPPLPPMSLPDEGGAIDIPVVATAAAEEPKTTVPPDPDADLMPALAKSVERISGDLANGMTVSLFKDDDPLYKSYVATGVITADGDGAQNLGSGISSSFMSKNKLSSAGGPACYIIYAPKHGMPIYHGFIAPIAKVDSVETAVNFLVAHETGRCLDQYEREITASAQMGWSAEKAGALGIAPAAFGRVFGKNMATAAYATGPLRKALDADPAQRQYVERVADIFAIGWARKLGANSKAIDEILATRERAPLYDPQNTAAVIPLARTFATDGDTAALWAGARAAQQQVGVDASLDVGSAVAANPEAFPIASAMNDSNDKKSWKIGITGLEPITQGTASANTTVAAPKSFDDLPRFGSNK
jgi:hypothetical protein